jgi:hypothetical protein
MTHQISTTNARAFLGRRARRGAGGHSMGDTGPESTVRRTASGGGGEGIGVGSIPAGADAGQGRA